MVLIISAVIIILAGADPRATLHEEREVAGRDVPVVHSLREQQYVVVIINLIIIIIWIMIVIIIIGHIDICVKLINRIISVSICITTMMICVSDIGVPLVHGLRKTRYTNNTSIIVLRNKTQS